MRIQVLGTVRLVAEDGGAVEIPERKVRALVAALVRNPGETVSADTLVSRVWGEQLPGNPSRVLQAKLSQLRALLDRAVPGGRELLTRSAGGYRLRVEEEQLDAAAFRAAIGRAAELPPDDRRIELLGSTLKLWQGRPYAEFGDALWLSAEVADLEEARLRGVELCAEALMATGRPERVVTMAAPFLTEHPTREGLAVPLLLAYCRTRRQPEALAVYERLRSHLADELGVEPAAELQQLHLRILRQDPRLVAPALPAPATDIGAGGTHADVPGGVGDRAERSAGVRPVSGARTGGWLPSYASAFLGRETETARVLELLGEHRLVTLLGIGGIGKTRLAVHAARTLADEEAAEVWFVDLAEAPGRSEDGPAGSAERIYRTAAEALQLSAPWQTTENMPARVLAALEARDAVLLLDNCEQVIDGVAAFTGELLRRAPRVRVLATSREPMGLAEEQRFVVPQLSVSGGTGPAVEFFLSRAQAVNAAITADAETRAAVADLCQRLDGLPLALELAAARMPVLGVPDLLERITERLDLLARPDRAAPRRQQTLRGMLDWSWSLLEAEEQTLLRRLAVHPVLWRLDVIEQVCADPGQQPAAGGAGCAGPGGAVIGVGGPALLPRRRVVDVLTRLVERSLVSAVTVGGEVRYRLLETVGAYAAEKLAESGERDAVAARHIDYCRVLVDCAQDFLFGPRATEWVQRLDEAWPHLSHAIAESLRREDGAAAVALVQATFWYRWMTGRMDSLVEELSAAAVCPQQGSTAEERRAYAQVKVLAATAEERPAREKAERVLAALEAFDADEQSQLARMQVQWFAASVMLGDAEHRERGRQLAEDAIGHLLAAGDLHGAALGSTQRDWFLLEFWDIPPQGLPGEHDAERILRDHGDAYGLTQVLGVQHLWAESQGQQDESRRLADEVTALSARLHLDGEAAYWQLVQAVLCLREGDLDTAQAHLDHGYRLARRAAFAYCLPFHDGVAAMLAQRRGDVHRAERLLEGLSAEERAGVRRTLARYVADDALPGWLRPSPA